MTKSKALRSKYAGAHEVDVSFACGETWYDLSLTTDDPESKPITTRDVLNAVAEYIEEHSLSGVTTVEVDADFEEDLELGEDEPEPEPEGEEDEDTKPQFGNFRPL